MTQDLCTLCALTGEVLFEYKECPDKDKLNWEKIYDLSLNQSVLPTVAYAVTENAPKDLRKKWIADIYGIERNNYSVYLGNRYISDLLRANRIPFVIIKGLASSSYYRKEYFRMQGDVDFLIPKDMVEETKAIMQKDGFVIEGELDYEIIYTKNGISYELHTEVNGIPDGGKEKKVREYLETIIETAVPYRPKDQRTGHAAEQDGISSEPDQGGICIPDEFHHGLVILLHTAKHLIGFGIGLRQISDWAVFINEVGERFPAVFEKALKECGLWEFARALSAVCVRYLHMKPLKWTGTYPDDFMERLMDDLTRKGNLCHDETDDMDSVLIEKADKGGVADSPVVIQAFKNLGGKARYRWPFMKKAKILIPFGVIIMCTQYGFGIITGRYKKIDPLEITAKAKERKTLYKKLKLFE